MEFVGLHSVFIMKEVYATVDARYAVRMVVGVTSVVCLMSHFVGGGGGFGFSVLRLRFLGLDDGKFLISLFGIGNCSQMIRELRSKFCVQF